MNCRLDNSIALMLNVLILINVLWLCNRKSLFLGNTLKYLWLQGMSVNYSQMFQKKNMGQGERGENQRERIWNKMLTISEFR